MATLVRWDPVREVAALQNEMGRLFGMLREGNGQAARSWVPALDVWENDNEMVYAFDLPGIPEDEISVEFEDGSLTVSAERERAHEVSDERYYRFERHSLRQEAATRPPLFFWPVAATRGLKPDRLRRLRASLAGAAAR